MSIRRRSRRDVLAGADLAGETVDGTLRVRLRQGDGS